MLFGARVTSTVCPSQRFDFCNCTVPLPHLCGTSLIGQRTCRFAPEGADAGRDRRFSFGHSQTMPPERQRTRVWDTGTVRAVQCARTLGIEDLGRIEYGHGYFTGFLNPTLRANLSASLHAGVGIDASDLDYVFATPVLGGQLSLAIMIRPFTSP